MKDTTNWVGLIADLGRHLFCDSIVVEVQDIINALGIQSREGLKPIICHHHKIDTGWHIVINIPVGLCSDDILHWQQYFEEQLHAIIEPEVHDNKVHLNIYTDPLPNEIPYHFNPANYPNMKVPVPIGLSYRGWEVVDLSKLPHLFIGGTPGSGKTTEIINIIDALLQQGISISLIDLKRLDFGYLQDHVHLAEDSTAAVKVLNDTLDEMYQRTRIIRANRCRNWREYKGDMPYKVLIIDEIAELKDRKAQDALESVVRLCRGAGISVIGACQRPSAKTWKSGEFREVISLFDARICYRVVDTHNSEIILGDGNTSAYTHIGPEDQGRGIWKYKGERLVQSMIIEDPWAQIETIPKKVVKENEPVPTQGNRYSPK